tara:strand:+ start:132 stop:833 length:702 start_codon:yes stop_codon:yes gene_type:complete
MKNILLLLLSLNIYSQTIESYFEIPKDYKRIIKSDYHDWIITRDIKVNIKAKTYDNYEVHGLNKTYIAVFDYNIGTRDLHQCADAVMYNNARYFFETKQYKKISYTFSHNARVYSYTKEFNVFNEKTFKKYITMVWGYCGTWSLQEYDTVKIDVKEMQVGDMFLIGGFPGHAMSVVDMIENNNGKKKFMLAQSFMPAQEQHILLNVNDVWFNSVNEIPWSFTTNNLRRFKNRK